MKRHVVACFVSALVAFICAAANAKEYLKNDISQQRAYSDAVITEGGKIVWLAGVAAPADDSGKSLGDDFDGQVRLTFKRIQAILERTGGHLNDMVQMTVFITDVRYSRRVIEIRKEIFGDNFAGSALITVAGLADPRARIEVQGFAVIGGH